jgi:hypothetical protein
MADGKSQRPESASGLISGATLCELSGLTDRRHRQIAAEGFFPPPVRGQYQLRASVAGLFRYYRELQVKRGANLAQKRERKIDNENTLLELEIAREEGQSVSVDEMVARLTPACAAMRTRILGSGLSDGERDALLGDVGQLLEDAIKTPSREFHLTEPSPPGEGEAAGAIPGGRAKAAANPKAAAAPVRKRVG